MGDNQQEPWAKKESQGCFPMLRTHDLKSQLDNISEPPLPQLRSKDGNIPLLWGWGGMKGAVMLSAHPPTQDLAPEAFKGLWLFQL